jgi:hypothetical protein
MPRSLGYLQKTVLQTNMKTPKDWHREGNIGNIATLLMEILPDWAEKSVEIF